MGLYFREILLITDSSGAIIGSFYWPLFWPTCIREKQLFHT